MRLSKSKRLRAQVMQAYAIFNHDPQIMSVAVEAMLDELDHANLPDEEAASVWLERQCMRVLREVGLEVAQMNGLQLAPLSSENTRGITIKRSDIQHARAVLARNLSRLTVALLWLLPFAACSSACAPPSDAVEHAASLALSPWCYETHALDDGAFANVLHFGVIAREGTPWRVDVSSGADVYDLPGKAAEPSDTYVKVRVDGLPAAWSKDVGVTLYTARGGAWVAMDKRGSMGPCDG